ncbi:hypothetical protein JFY74_19295 [Pectobacterium carotovorum]|nr:hypothetical protein JFY74_19295 [Pectobacterium carotovorum]
MLYQLVEQHEALWRATPTHSVVMEDSIRHFPPSERMNIVRKALRKADQAGAIEAQRRLWALVYLEGGRQALEKQKGRT